MKRNLLLSMTFAASLFSMNMFAQSPNSTANTCANATECAELQCNNPSTCNKDGNGSGKCDKSKKFKGSRIKNNARRDIFAGLNLTQDQKTRLESLQASRKSKLQQRAAKGVARDSSLTSQQRREMKLQRDSMARTERLEFIREVGEIVGPDNYVVFLENMVVNQPSGRQHGMRAANHKKIAHKSAMKSHRHQKDKMRKSASTQTPRAANVANAQ